MNQWAEDIKKGESSLVSLLACTEESISERERVGSLRKD